MCLTGPVAPQCIGSIPDTLSAYLRGVLDDNVCGAVCEVPLSTTPSQLADFACELASLNEHTNFDLYIHDHKVDLSLEAIVREMGVGTEETIVLNIRTHMQAAGHSTPLSASTSVAQPPAPQHPASTPHAPACSCASRYKARTDASSLSERSQKDMDQILQSFNQLTQALDSGQCIKLLAPALQCCSASCALCGGRTTRGRLGTSRGKAACGEGYHGCTSNRCGAHRTGQASKCSGQSAA